MGAVLEIRGLSKSFGRRKALQGIDLVAGPGELLAFLGPNGAGKTTFLKVVSTLLTPSSGSVRIEGFDVVEEPEEARRRIGCVFHDFMLYDDLTVGENLAFFGRLYDSHATEEHLDRELERMGLLHRKADRVSTLSRGMKQRLALARAMLNGPHLLLLDEPFTGLDEAAVDTLKATLRAFASSSGPVLLTTHDPRLAHGLASRMFIIVRGQVVREVRPDRVPVESFVQEYREQLGALP